MSILPQYKNKSCKVLIKEKMGACKSSTTISTASLNNNYFKILTSKILNCSFRINKIYLTQKFFSSWVTETWKRWREKTESMAIVNYNSCHCYIFPVFNIDFLSKEQEKSCLVMFILLLYYSPKHSKGLYSDTALKTLQMRIAAVNCFRQYQLNFS